MDNQAKAAPVRQFSTRFLPNDGIPEYNALLDNHLGKRREFLLGNRHSLELMQQTGVIQRVEAQPDNPNQYVVHIAEKPIHRRKRLPPRSASGPLQLPESQTMPWRQHSATLELRRSNTNASRLNPDGFLDNGNCDDVSAAKKANAATLKAANRLALFGSTKCSALLEASNKHRVSSDVSPPDAIEIRSRSRPVSTSKGTALKRLVGSTTVKGTVEHLLESDAAFMTQIRTMKEQLADLHRLSKAEEEFMKLVTQQQEVKKDVDRVRRELLSMRKVRQKLQEDIEDVAQANQSYEEKIYASKIIESTPEEAVVVDVAKLMGAVKERRHALVGLNGTGRALTILQPSTATPTNGKASRSPNERRHPKTLVDYCTAFRVLQNSMGFSDLESLEEQFTTTEEQLLSKYKANLALADEVTALEKEISAVNNEKKINRANVRGIAQASEKIERDMQIRIQSVLSSIKCYNELREQRNREHAKLRDIMLRCLDALQIDVRGSELPDANGNNGSAKATLDRRLIGPKHLAVTLKVKHSSRILELPPEALRLNRGHDGRRSNMFSTRETSKIVLGPREPSGSALSAILGTVQPPSIENAVALTENVSMMEVMHGMHRAVSQYQARYPSTRIIQQKRLAAMIEADKEDEEEDESVQEGEDDDNDDF
ncbi:ODA1/DCC2 family [Phytophthora cactorum]|nr:ODA1/DCC2 family [Phytophthora cactorum]